MPSLKSIRLRIASVKSTQKITRAMKLVAAAKLRRAQDAIVAARPYARALGAAVAEVAGRAGAEAHPLLARIDNPKTLLIAITSDRGLAGGFNTNVLRAAFVERDQAASRDALQFEVVGRKGRDTFRRRKLNVHGEHAGVTGETALARARELAAVATAELLAGHVGRVGLIYNEFKSAIQQRVVVEPVLPVSPPAEEAGAPGTDFVYEPTREQLLDTLLPLYVESQIYRALLESIASEHGARMTAMENATNNAREMIGRYTLQYNRARQAAITKELMEIVGGAEALKG